MKDRFPEMFDDVLKKLPDDEEDEVELGEEEEDIPDLSEPFGDEESMEEEESKPFPIEEHHWALFPYFSKEFAQEVTSRYDSHIELWMGRSGYAKLVFDSYKAYHGLDGSMLNTPSVSLEMAGEQGELLSMRPNSVRSLLKHQIAMVTADRPAWEPQANNANSEAQRQVPMVSNLLDYALGQGLHKALVDQFEAQKVSASAFMVLGWDPNLGLNRQGWFTNRVIQPWEMAHERVRDYEDCSWWIWRTFENRWDWIARFAESDPKKAADIHSINQSDEAWGVAPLDGHEEADVECGGDRIAVLNVYIKPTASCPLGRLAKIAGDGLVLEDGGAPYGDTVPVVRMCAAEFVGTAVPYAESWMLLAPAEAINVIVGTMMTRVDMFGIPSVAAPPGSELQPGDFGGANFLELGAGEKPTVIDLLNIPDALPKMAGFFNQMLEDFSGVNSVTRGKPAENISSGSMAALLQAMAIQYNSTDERAWALNLERVGTILLRIFQRMASTEVLVAVTGMDHTTTAAKFKGEDVSSVMQVSVKIANAMSKTTAGKMQIADNLLQNKMISTPAEYMNALQTGQLESLFASPTSHLRIAKSEDEMILRGEVPSVMVWDNDQIHLREHVAMFNNDTRYDQQKAQIASEHCQQHMDSWAKKSRENPDFCMAMGQPVLPMAGSIGEQGRAMQQQQPGMPPAPPVDKGSPPPQMTQPNSEPTKAAPGPKGAPPGQQPSKAMPKEPEPAKTPAGTPVV